MNIANIEMIPVYCIKYLCRDTISKYNRDKFSSIISLIKFGVLIIIIIGNLLIAQLMFNYGISNILNIIIISG